MSHSVAVRPALFSSSSTSLIGPQRVRPSSRTFSLSGLSLRRCATRRERVAVAPAASRMPRDEGPSDNIHRDVSARAAANEVVAASGPSEPKNSQESLTPLEQQLRRERDERKARRQSEQMTYQFAAVAASCLVTSTAIVATWYRFVIHADGSPFPVTEFFSTLLLIVGGTIGMEMYARYAHRILWHDFQPGWALHKSHHEPRDGPFELNDIYAVANALPAIALCAYGFLTPGVFGGVCFGLGLGITIFGISYMFVHDGMVHKRFPVGPIAELPYLKRVAVAHRVHHSERYEGVPYGLFLGPQELEAVGGGEYLDQLVEQLDVSSPSSSSSRR